MNGLNCYILKFYIMDTEQLKTKLKDLLDLAEKSPQVRELQKQIRDIQNGRNISVSKKVIDDAFDACKVIVKQVSNDPDEQLELQKHAVKHYMCHIIRSNGYTIVD